MSLNVFNSASIGGVIIPPFPMSVRNNCQSGRWTIGEREYDGEQAFAIIKFSRFFGDLGRTYGALWGQLWLIPVRGSLPNNVVMVSYIKSWSLEDFDRLIIEVQASGNNPGEGIFIPQFKRHNSQKNGEPISYYSLGWEWEPNKDKKALTTYGKILSDPSLSSRLVDPEGTRQLYCLDDLNDIPPEISEQLGQHSSTPLLEPES